MQDHLTHKRRRMLTVSERNPLLGLPGIHVRLIGKANFYIHEVPCIAYMGECGHVEIYSEFQVNWGFVK